MSIRIAINGFGRIGRTVLRIILKDHPDIEVVAVNDITDSKTLVHLLKYDSVMGPLDQPVELKDKFLKIGERSIQILEERDLSKLPWKEMKLDFVIEATGVFRKREQIEKHIEAGAPKVLLTVPAKDEIDATIVLGVNNEELKAEDKIISNASCTTNCLAPVAKILNDNFGLEYGLMTTIHGYTNDQRLVDAPHKDLRRARAAALNIIPTTTGAARTVGKVIKELNGKLDGMAMRVPVPDGSCVDLVATLKQEVSINDINEAIKKAAEGPLKGVLAYTEDPIVSNDIVGNPNSSIFDGLSTQIIGDATNEKGEKVGKLVKIITWYDNEYGYSYRVVDLIRLSCNLNK